MARPVRFALAFGGGGARGLAHVGVLRVLERAGLRPSAIAGTSMGAIVGALYCSGVAPDDLVEALDLLDLKGLLAVTRLNLRPGSLLTADPFEGRIRAALPLTFRELLLPFAAVAADLITGERVVLADGDLAVAVRASMSIPVVFEPVRVGERLLTDGGIIDPVPVDAARGLTGDPVVAVDVGPLTPVTLDAGAIGGHKPVLRIDGHLSVAQVGTRAFDVAQHWLARPHLEDAAAVITPHISGYTMADFLDGEAIVAAGERAAEDSLPAVVEALTDAARTPLGRAWHRLTSSEAAPSRTR